MNDNFFISVMKLIVFFMLMFGVMYSCARSIEETVIMQEA